MIANYNFGVINDNDIVYAPKRIIENGEQIINPTAEMYLERGYYPIEATEPPNEEQEYTAVYTLEDGKIVQSWEALDA